MVNYKATKMLVVGAPQVGKTTTKDRLLGKIENLEKNPESHMKPSTGFEKATEVCLDDIVYAKKDATIISSKRSKSAWNAKNVKELVQCLLRYIRMVATGQLNSAEGNESDQSSMPENPNESSSHENIEEAIDDNGESVSFDEADRFIRHAYSEDWKEELVAHLEHSTTAYIIDSGGQPEFQDILPLLFRGPAFYLIFFSLAESLDECYTIKYTNKDGRTINAYESAYSVKQILLQLTSTFAHTVSEDKCLVKPTAFLFATHRDGVTREEMDSVNEELKQLFQQSKILEDASKSKKYDTLFVPVNNLNGTMLEVNEMQEFLAGYVEKHCESVKIPTTWLLFHFMLRSEYENEKVCSLEECTKLANGCGIAAAHVVEVLDYIHQKLGTILYFKDVSCMKEYVICDPEILFQSISRLIEKVFDENESVHQNGEIAESTLAAAVQSYDQSLSQSAALKIPVQNIIDLLKHHLIITALSKEESSDPDDKECHFFMPCLLRPDPDPKLKLEPSEACFEKDPLVIYLSGKIRIIPAGLVTALAIELRSLKLWKLVSKQRYKNHYFFKVHNHSTAELIVRSTHLELHCDLGDPKRTKISRNHLRYKLYQDIKAAISNVITELNYPEPVFGLYCSKGDQYHLVRCDVQDEQLQCDDDPNHCPRKNETIIYASPGQLEWFKVWEIS